MNATTKAIPGMLMAAALLTIQLQDCNQREAEAIADNIVEKARTAGAGNFQACIGEQMPSTQIIETCRETVAQKAGRTCQEITGRLATEVPSTLDLCKKAYQYGMTKAESVLR